MGNNFSVNLNTKVPHRHDDCGVCRRIEQTRRRPGRERILILSENWKPATW